MFFMPLDARRAAHNRNRLLPRQLGAAYIGSPLGYQLTAAPPPRYEPQQQSQTDETGAHFAEAALSYAVPGYPIVKAGAGFLASPNYSDAAKAGGVFLAAYLLSPDIRKEVNKVLKSLFR